MHTSTKSIVPMPHSRRVVSPWQDGHAMASVGGSQTRDRAVEAADGLSARFSIVTRSAYSTNAPRHDGQR